MRHSFLPGFLGLDLSAKVLEERESELGDLEAKRNAALESLESWMKSFSDKNGRAPSKEETKLQSKEAKEISEL